jgi:hypothetical protein
MMYGEHVGILVVEGIVLVVVVIHGGIIALIEVQKDNVWVE